MVYFYCDACGDSLKKPQVANHLFRCRGCQLLRCVDCGIAFDRNSYKAHNSCISEAEKYQKSLYRGPKSNTNSNANNNNNSNNAAPKPQQPAPITTSAPPVKEQETSKKRKKEATEEGEKEAKKTKKTKESESAVNGATKSTTTTNDGKKSKKSKTSGETEEKAKAELEASLITLDAWRESIVKALKAAPEKRCGKKKLRKELKAKLLAELESRFDQEYRKAVKALCKDPDSRLSLSSDRSTIALNN